MISQIASSFRRTIAAGRSKDRSEISGRHEELAFPDRLSVTEMHGDDSAGDERPDHHLLHGLDTAREGLPTGVR